MFELGRTLATPGALQALVCAEQLPTELLRRHLSGDWGDVDKEDWRANDRALKDEERLFSAYILRTDVKVWVITEWDRSATTLLLPEEY